MATSAELLAQALKDHEAGRLHQAKEIYLQILQENPDHADAWHFLGMIAHQQGEHAAAVEHMRKALSFNPDNAAYHSNLGAAHADLGQPEEAAASYREALRVYPDFPEAHNNLGNTLKELGKLEEAVAHFREALRLKPAYSEAHNNLGTVLKEQDKLEEAGACYREALRHRPDYASAHLNLGSLFRDQDKLDEALTCLRTAVRLQPDLAQGHYNLANVLLDQEKRQEAIASYRQAVRLQPDFADAQSNLGNALRKEGLLEEAVAACREAVRLKPKTAATHNMLGSVLMDRFQLEEASASFRQALALDPELAEAHCNLGVALKDQGRPEEAVACCRKALHLNPDLKAVHTNFLFTLNLDPRAQPADLYAEHRRWGERAGPKTPVLPHANDPDPERRLRIGYVSPDLRQHSVAYFFEPILAHHDPARVETYCYAEVRKPDSLTTHLQGLAHAWRSTCGQSDDEAAGQIRTDRIDILVDLAGHTSNNRLGVFALKPAPVQVTYLGYPNTTGLSTIDYRLTDDIADPPGEPTVHTEELVRLPGGFCCYNPSLEAPPVAPLPALATGRVTFGALHNLAKINVLVIELWCAVLKAVPTSRLMIYRDILKGKTAEFFQQQFQDRGLGSDRVQLLCEAPGGLVLNLYAAMDIFLDTFPWGGHTTSYEALWMGVPVLTLYGNRHAARWASSVQTRLGLTELVAGTTEAYVAAAARLAGDLEHLARLRAILRDMLRQSPFCNGLAFTRRLEEAYRSMWRRWCSSKKAANYLK